MSIFECSAPEQIEPIRMHKIGAYQRSISEDALSNSLWFSYRAPYYIPSTRASGDLGVPTKVGVSCPHQASLSSLLIPRYPGILPSSLHPLEI